MNNRHPPYKTCPTACTDMNIRLTPRGRRTNVKSLHNTISFVTYTDIEVLTEVMPKTLLMLIAEVGGYLGLTLGVSLLDLKTFAPASWNFVKARLEQKLDQIKSN